MRKILTISVFLLLIIAGLVLSKDANAQSSAYSAGDLIKTRDSSTVYYFGFDGKRHAFPNEAVYFSWYSNFDGIKIVTPQELAEIPLGSNIVVRPGTYLVKIQTDPKVYVVEPYGALYHLPSEAMARALFGDNWAARVIDIDVSLFPDYKVKGQVQRQVHPDGTVFKYTGDEANTYILKNNKAWRFKDLAKAEAHRYQDRFILRLDKSIFNYPLGSSEILEIHPLLIDTAQTLKLDAIFSETPTSYSSPVTTPSVTTPSQPATIGNGLMGYYFKDMNFGRLVQNRIDSVIAFNWDTGSPLPIMRSDYFSVRWIGKLKIDTSKEYTFWTYSDDGVRLYIDDVLVIDDWNDHKAEWNGGVIYLTAGYHDIKLEYYERSGFAVIKLCWNDKNTLVPTSNLFVETAQYYQSY